MSLIIAKEGLLRHVIFSWLCLVPFWCFSQQSELELASKRIAQLDYTGAIRILESVVETYGPVGNSSFQLATCYRLSNQLESARYWYAQAVRLPDVPTEDLLHYAEVLQQSGECSQSIYWLNKYMEIVRYDRRATNLKKACEEGGMLLEKGNGIYLLSLLPFNSPWDEFGATFFGEGLIYCSESTTSADPALINASTGRPFFQLYQVEGDWSFATPSALPENLRSALNDSAPAYCAQTNELFFTRNNSKNGQQLKGSDGLVQLGLFRTFYEGDGKWANPRPLGINSLEFSCMHPALSKDGQRLFFSSDMPGGFGGLDIYTSDRMPDGTWGPPINLGAPINTEGNEVFPFLAEENQLYFSSDGHIGLGGMDVFRIDLQARQKPENLGGPVNSPQDDFGFKINSENDQAIMSSNRPGGVGGDDLYLVEHIAATYTIEFLAADSGQPLSNFFMVSDCGEDSIYVRNDARVQIEMPLNACCQWNIEIPGYQPFSQTLCTHNLSKRDSTQLAWQFEPLKPLFLEGVIFDQGTGLPLQNALVTLESSCGDQINPINTEPTGYYNFELKRGCCYKVKAKLKSYLAAGSDNICLGADYEAGTHRVNLYLQPTIYDGGNLFQSEVEEKQAVYRDAITGLWMDQYSNQPADGTYPDGWIYDRGLIVRQGALVDRRSAIFLKGRSKARYNEPIPFLLNIYYEFNSAQIQESAKPELKKLRRLLEDNPEIRIEVGAHTDARGTSSYNKRLSQKRAEAIANWLIQSGIARNRIQAVGYGESKLINSCTEDSACSEAEHQLNRRTEFKVLKD